MKVRVVGSYGCELGPCRTSTYLIDDRVLIDAGSACAGFTLEQTRAIEGVALTHVHLDHIASLPFLLDNRFGEAPPLHVYATREVIAALRVHLFNNKLWPDCERIPDPRTPVLRFVEISHERPFEVAGLMLTAYAVNHTVRTVGYHVSNGRGSIVFSGDTGPTDRIWEKVNEDANLRAIFLEVSFPSRLAKVAEISKHLCTVTLRREILKLPRGVPVYLNHLKPAFEQEIRREITPIAAEVPHLRFAEQDETYVF